MMRVQDEKEEERYRKLDELMRNKQKLSRRRKRKKQNKYYSFNLNLSNRES